MKDKGPALRQQEVHGAAIEAVLADTLPKLRSTLISKLRRHPGRSWDVEDVLQDALARALAAMDGLRDRTPNGVRAWITRIAWNCAKDRIRKEGRITTVEEQSALPHDSGEAPALEPCWPLRRALHQSPPEERLVLWIRATQRLSWETTSKLTLAPTARVTRLVHQRALESLRRRAAKGLGS